ncbi:MAG TPA: DUF445 domain-containing protein, partial [Gemmataceae bacterium]|nr:DUF445 domain-containing protein [Gemmataceae bacterium]
GVLFGALVLVVIGSILERTKVSEFWGGLILASGEAGLVGGLADWFAVRALFTHPLGIKIFPHTALIPRNRRRIVREIRNLVQNEWLTKEMLLAKIDAYDFIGDGVLPTVAALKPKLRSVVRTVARDVLDDVSPQELARFLSQSAGATLDARKLAPFLAEVVRRVREEGWLGPMLQEAVQRFHRWASSPENRLAIHHHLSEAAGTYRGKSVWKNLTYSVAEWSGGIDLEDAAEVLQDQISEFAEEQLGEHGAFKEAVRDGLRRLEEGLRDDPEFLGRVQDFLQDSGQSGLLASALAPLLTSVKAEALRQIDDPDSPALVWVLDRLQEWIDRLAQEPDTRDRFNRWCKRTANDLIEKHHALIGAMVEDRLNRFDDATLVKMIEDKVGEDLNWIRINGSVVGGCVGVLIYLTISAVHYLMLHV